MSITSGASPGVQVNSAAKDSAASATALASQTAAAVDEVIVPNGIGTNNEGNLESTPSYVGRLFALRWGATGATAVVVNDEGNLESSPVYPGRLVCIRWAATGAVAVVVNAAGSGYVVDEVITDNGAGATAARRARMIVTSVDGGGGVTGIKMHEAGDAGTPGVTKGRDVGEYSVEGTATARATTASASGTGLTVDLTFEDVQEIRYITADASNTLTVHNEWLDGPANGENWRVSYIIQDAATVTGLGLVNKRVDDFNSSRRFQVTNAGTNGGWMFFGDGVSLETSAEGNPTGPADVLVNNGGRLDLGYIQQTSSTLVRDPRLEGIPVAGASMFGAGGAGTNDGDLVLDCDAGGVFNIFDFFMKGVNDYEMTLNGEVTMRSAKFFSMADSVNLTGDGSNPVTIRDWRQEGRANTADTITIDTDTDIDGAIIIATNGFRFGTAAETNTVRNVTMLDSNLNFVTVPDNASSIFEFVNPVWNLDTSDQTQIAFTGTVNGTVREQFEITLDVSENDGTTAISGATCKLFSTGDDILVSATDSDAAGEVAIIKTTKTITPNGASALTVVNQDGHFVRIDEYTWEPFIVVADDLAPLDAGIALQPDADITQTVQATAITNGSGVEYQRQMTLDYDAQTANFTVGSVLTGGTAGATGTILADNDAGGSGTLTLERVLGVFDDNETITDAVTGSATVNEPTAGGDPTQGITNRLDYYLIEYESGNANAIQIGETITVTNAGTDTTGEAKHVRGDSGDGFVLLENWNGVAPDAGATLSGATSSHSSTTTNPTNTFEFGYFIEGNSRSVTAIYDYQQARAAEATLTQEFEDLLAIFVQNGANQKPFQRSGSTDGITRRSIAAGGAGTGYYIGNESGTIADMTDNQGDTFTPPVTINLTYTGLKDNTEVRVYAEGTTTELAGVENATDGAPDDRSVTFSLPAATVVDVRFMNFEWTVPDRNSILNFTWPSSNTSIPITQVLDRVSDNP